MTLVPARRPCSSCPYRRDVPSGVWDATEYEKLRAYDNETAYQPSGAFFCHRQDGRLCAGWVAVHDMDESLGFRLYARLHQITEEEYVAILDYETDAELFATGAQAAEHGLRDLSRPSPSALRMIARIGALRGDP